MLLYHPNVQLIRRTHMDKPNEYWLHAITFCHKAKYKAAGFDLKPPSGDADPYRIELHIAPDEDIPEFEILTPVVHTVYLGNLPISEQDGRLEISLQVPVQGQDTQAARTIVSSSSAKEEREKPWMDL